MYRAGPLTLAVGEDLAQHPDEWPGRRTSGSEAIVVLTGSRPVVLSVDGASRGRFSLQFMPAGRGHPSPTLSDGRAAVRFPTCPGRLHRFGGGVLFTGTGCTRLHVEQLNRPATPMLIPIGNTLTGCEATRPTRTLSDATLPFLGVACPVGNSIACDRVESESESASTCAGQQRSSSSGSPVGSSRSAHPWIRPTTSGWATSMTRV